MTVFTRSSWAYWGDRIGIAIITGGFGAFLLIATTSAVTRGQEGLGPIPIIAPIAGIILIILGIRGLLRPWPTQIEIDTTEVRIYHRPEKTIILPKKSIIEARKITAYQGGSVIGFAYRDTKGKQRSLLIYGGWRDEHGTPIKNAIVDIVNAKLRST